MPSLSLRHKTIQWLNALQLRILPGNSYGRMAVRYACDSETREQYELYVRYALTILVRNAPTWARRVERELASVILADYGPDVSFARFSSLTRECLINTGALPDNRPPAAGLVIAFVLVHEATHGWLVRHGVRTSTPERTLRIERVCNRAEACLAARIPELPFLLDIVAARRARIPATYATSGIDKRNRAYYRALMRGIIGR